MNSKGASPRGLFNYEIKLSILACIFWVMCGIMMIVVRKIV
jgi:hypothetical protein